MRLLKLCTVIVWLFTTSACNFGDPVTFTASTCERDSDCNDRGECILVQGRQLCQCEQFYDGANCDRCVPGHVLEGTDCVMANNENISPNNVTTPTNNVTNQNNPNMCAATETACADDCCVAGEFCDGGVCAELFVGRRCTNDAACGDGRCFAQVDTGITAGYCTQFCDADNACPVGSVCNLANFCVANCNEDGGCARSELQCGKPNPAGPDACNPFAGGAGAVGDACASLGDCMGGFVGSCRVDSPSGYCTQGCMADTDCPTGSHCFGGNCVADCTDPRDCRAGYTCVDYSFDGSLECLPLSMGRGEVGSACDAVTDCAGAALARCYVGPTWGDDGYCAQDCTPAGTACPNGSVCTDAGFARLCMEDCVSDADCTRPGYTCGRVGVESVCVAS